MICVLGCPPNLCVHVLNIVSSADSFENFMKHDRETHRPITERPP